MLDAIWTKYMATRTARQDASLRLKVTQTLTPYSEALLRKSLDWRDRNQVERGGIAGRQAQVTQLNSHIYISDLDKRTCTCGDVNYKENGVLCGHTVSLLAGLYEWAIDYILSKLGRDNWVTTCHCRKMFSQLISPLFTLKQLVKRELLHLCTIYQRVILRKSDLERVIYGSMYLHRMRLI